MTKGKRAVMPRRVSSSCPKPEINFNKLHTVLAHTTAIFKTGIYCMSSKQLCILSALEMKLPAQVSTCMSELSDCLIRNVAGTLDFICQTNSISCELLSMRLGASSGFCAHLVIALLENQLTKKEWALICLYIKTVLLT